MPMIIKADQLSKRYDRNWIFREFSYEFIAGQQYAVTGHNGSGKSTLIRILSGMQSFSEGTLSWTFNNRTIPKEKIFQFISFCAPGMELIEEMTLEEFLHFHYSFKELDHIKDTKTLISLLRMEKMRRQKLSEFSSGMKQRIKLAQAFFSKTPLLLLDEPTTNLDEEWIHFYQECLGSCTEHRLVLIASNDAREYKNAHHEIELRQYQ